MSRVKRLIDSYGKHIAVPWREVAAAQRVIFCVYNETDELRLRAKIDEFELVTRKAEHEWILFDLTNSFGEWISKQRYASSYFERPQLLNTVISKYLDFIDEKFLSFLIESNCSDNTVVALQGVGSLFGFLRVKDVVDRLAPKVKGRLVVLFPGKYEGNNYRLLDGYDGWNYLAIAITPDKEM
ncbi:BREX protein BrxB domain-containing protein [Neobacillus niacini]|uniref:BREX protein BrxB domain-containing protein n=1 Tax=Neobacillus niacini TaxID=86668 RepID=UPI001C8D7AA4|nr:BREX protein BrxB domain-containing protein [Neobacillus niacini]MBY0147752.1 DUF1788 domain-containing protein [Neobacillus niacini]